MEIRIKVHDQWAGLLIAFLRSLSYVERVEEQSAVVPETATSAPTPPSEGEFFTRVSGVWDEPDFDFAKFRRQAWGREI
jgi:hypothetical protein